MDFLGTALVMGASLCLLLALQYAGSTYAWDSSVVIGLLGGSVLITVALAAAELWQGERAMLTPRLIRQRSVWVCAVWGFFFAGSYFAVLYYLPIYFQSIVGTGAIGSGVRNIPFVALFGIGTLGSGMIITKTGIAAPYMPVSSVSITIGSGLLYTLGIGTSAGKWVGYQILTGFGFGIGLQIPVIIAQAYAAPADMAPVSAIIICKILFSSVASIFRAPLCPLANCVPLAQSPGPPAPRSCSQLSSPVSQISSDEGLPAPRPPSIPHSSRPRVPLICTATFPGPSWTESSVPTHGESRLLSLLLSGLPASLSFSVCAPSGTTLIRRKGSKKPSSQENLARGFKQFILTVVVVIVCFR